MKRLFILVAALSLQSTVHAQNPSEVVKDSAWTKKGNIAILGSQSSFSNWQAGGSNNVAINGALNYDINYKKND